MALIFLSFIDNLDIIVLVQFNQNWTKTIGLQCQTIEFCIFLVKIIHFAAGKDTSATACPLWTLVAAGNFFFPCYDQEMEDYTKSIEDFML
jgi:hypothetical protein